MSEALKTIPPFFDRQITPPPSIPLLTSQTDVLYYAPHPVRLLSQEGIEITPQKPTTLRRQQAYFRPAGSRSESYTHIYPTLPPGSRTVRFDARERSPSSNLSSVDDDDGKVDKPAGEFGRPGSGGYSLGPATLGWGKTEFEQLREHVNGLIQENLDERRCYSQQKQENIEIVRDAMLARFPQLDGFKNLWPINDLIKSRLKATSSLHRKKESLKEAGKEAGGKRTLAERTRSKTGVQYSPY